MASLQRNRANVAINSFEDYYRISILKIFVDYFIIQPEEIFVNLGEIVIAFMFFFTNKTERKQYESFVGQMSYGELRHTKSSIEKDHLRFKSGYQEAFLKYDRELIMVYPLLKILCKNKNKTYFRDTTSQHRWNGLLVLLYTKTLKANEVIDE